LKLQVGVDVAGEEEELQRWGEMRVDAIWRLQEEQGEGRKGKGGLGGAEDEVDAGVGGDCAKRGINTPKTQKGRRETY
jgi:hypothetical protein